MGNNVILIGMPGCGKSTVGIVLAKMTKLVFVVDVRSRHQAVEYEGPQLVPPGEFLKERRLANSTSSTANDKRRRPLLKQRRQ